MTALEQFWATLDHGSTIAEIERTECLELLAAQSVGRLAYVGDDGPRVLPVNFVLAEDAIVFRTVESGEVARYAIDRPCAFEIDQVHEFFEYGWSVLAVGIPQPLTAEELERLKFGRLPQPWAQGNRPLLVRMPCTQVSGRRLIPAG